MAIWQHTGPEGEGGRARFAFSDRWGGVSKAPYTATNLGGHVGDDPEAVAANRSLVAFELGFTDPGNVVYMNQIHGADVAYAAAQWQGRAPDVDALVTDRRHLALAVLVADCVPVLLADPAHGVVAAVHAGRVGAAAGVIPRAVEAFRSAGGDPATSDVLLGPAICGACYKVPADMQAAVEARLPGSAVRTRRGTPGLDLRAGLARQLAGLGVERIVTDPRCTAEDPDLYSHRRDGTTGRQAGVAWVE